MRHICTVFFLVLLTSCSFSKQPKYKVQKINGMEFSSLTLQNQLDVLLVSDSRFKKSSAAMAVSVGSLEDPETAQGMAHYLEHMLFLGTKDFPKPDEYSTYMETHGGWDNAYTSDEVTNYMFEVDNGAVEGALQRFSRFFVSPLFDGTYLEREKNAVHSEFEKNIKQDNWREDRYVNTLAKKSHPYSKFSTGSLKTLGTVSREDVIQFYRKYYSSNNMKLVIMSAQPMEQLRQLSEKYFSDVPNFNVAKPKYADFFFDFEQRERLHFIKSINDVEEMTILFNVPDEAPYWRSKPLSIIAKLIGDEGPGSLLSYLKSEGLALELSASDAFWRTFGVSITLTPKGRKEYQRVLWAVQQYLELVRKNLYPEYIYKDESSIRKMALDNLEPSSSGQRAASFARSLIDHPAEEFLTQKYLITEYSEKDFKTFLEWIDLKKAHILILSKNEKTNKKEDIFGVEYSKTAWTNSPAKTAANIEFRYPLANKYIPTDFSLVSGGAKKAEPQKKDFKSRATAYVQTDTELGIAKASIKIKILSAIEVDSRNAALLSLYLLAKEDEMREWSYPISEAGAQFQISGGETPDEIVLGISGYSQRLQTIFNDAIKDEKSGRSLNEVRISEKLFEDIKQRLKKDFINIDEAVAVQRLGFESKYYLSSPSLRWKDVLKSLEELKLKDVQDFSKKFFETTSIKVVAYGNIEVSAVEKMVLELQKVLGKQSLSPPQVREKQSQFRRVPVGQVYSTAVVGRNNNHAMLTYYHMAPWSVENHAMILVIGQILSQPYFSELRTNQQLGYVARAGGVHQLGFVGLSAMIQSPKVDSLQLQEKSHQFLVSFLQSKMKTLTDEELKPILNSIENELLMKPTTLGEREGEFYQAAIKYDGRFSIRKEIAKSLVELDAAKVKKFVEEHFLKNSPGQHTLYYYGLGTKLNTKKLPGKVFEDPSLVTWEMTNPYLKK